MKRVLAVGNALLDSLITLRGDELLERYALSKGSMSLVDEGRIGEILSATEGFERDSSLGGTAGNCARAMAHLGGVVGYVGKVGDDAAGESYVAGLEAVGITSRALVTKEARTGECLSLISEDGERTMATFLGAALTLSAEDITEELFEGFEVLFIEGFLVQNPTLIRRIFEVARSLDMMIAIDLASYNVVAENIELIRELVEDGVSIIFANEQEAEAYTSLSDPMAAAEELSKIADVAVVKIGAKGSITISGDEVVEVGATSHQRRDTTGAGDYFAGAFLKGFCAGENLVRCAEMGSVTGGAIIEVVGTTLSAEGWEAVKAEVKAILR